MTYIWMLEISVLKKYSVIPPTAFFLSFNVLPISLSLYLIDHLVMGPWAGGRDTYLRRQAIADRVHVVGGRCRVHEALGVAGEAVASSISRAGVRGCSGRSQAPLVHGGRREGLGPVHGAAPICGETQERA